MDNVEQAVFDLNFVVGDTINILMTFTDPLDPAFTLVGKQLDIDVVDNSGNVIRSFTSAGGSPTILIVTNTARLYSLTPFTTVGKYRFDLQLTSGSEISTISRGYFIIHKQYTT